MRNTRRWERRGLLVGAMATLLVGGCGGGGDTSTGGGGDPGGGPDPTPRLVQARVDLFWQARSRQQILTTLAPSSALSARVLLEDADGRRSSVVVDRRPDPSGYTDTLLLPASVKPGLGTLRITFFAEPAAAGAEVGVAQAGIAIPDSGFLPGVAVSGRVASVSVAQGQNLTAFTPAPLAYSVRDAENRLLALPPGALFWDIHGGDVLTRQDDGRFVGQRVGGAQVRLRVDQIASPLTTVQVVSNTRVRVAPEEVALAPGASATFAASVTDTNGGSTAVSWRVVESGGGAIDAQGRYTAPARRGTFHVEATSLFDGGKRARATVRVQSGSVSGEID